MEVHSAKKAEGDFFTVALQAPGRAWNRVAVLAGGCPTSVQSPPQHQPVQFTHGKLRLVGEVSRFDSEFTVRESLTQMRSRTPSKLAKGNFFRVVIVHFLKNTCLRMMECLHCELKAFLDCAYIHA